MKRFGALAIGGVVVGVILSLVTLKVLPVLRRFSTASSAATYTANRSGVTPLEPAQTRRARGWEADDSIPDLLPDHEIQRPSESRTDLTTWKPFSPVGGPLTGALDASDVLDPPAGRHGFLQVRDGRFVFEDGTPIRFFGVTIQGADAFPAHDHAERLAERLAQLGCNIVRFHHLDAPWATPNIFDPDFDDTQHLSLESLDRLDYFIAQLKRRGIYVYLDLLVSRAFKAGDGVPGYRRLEKGAKVVSQYSPRVMQLQKQYAKMLLTHPNPYMQTRLVDEPTLALVELVNESSLFSLPAYLESIPPVYLDELGMLWREYLDGQGLAEPEGKSDPYLDSRNPLVQEFYVSLQLRYFDELSTFLRRLGLKVPISGSNLSHVKMNPWDLVTHTSLDFIDRHGEWDPPKGGFGEFTLFHNRSMIEVVEQHNPIVKLSQQRVAGMPFVVSEWAIPWPNEFRAVGSVLMAAYASFQDWDGIIQFNYQGELAPTRIEGRFDVSTKPEFFLQFPAVARLFHRRDVAPARLRHSYPLYPKLRVKPSLALRHGLERVAQGQPPTRSAVDLRAPWISDTEELGWDAAQGVVLIETERTQAAIGRVGGVPVELRDVTFEMTTPSACVILTSVDDQPLARSRRLLLTTVARSENTGTVYNANRTQLRDSGSAPILMESVVGVMSLRLDERGAPQVFALDASGARVGELRLRVNEPRIEVPLGDSHAYELVFEGSGDDQAL